MFRFSSVWLTNEEFMVMVEGLQNPNSKIKRVFYDWNYSPSIDFDQSILAELGRCKKLDFLLIRGCRMGDPTFEQLMKNLKESDVQLKVLDLYSNNLSDKSIFFLSEFIKTYRYIESFGFGGNKISNITVFNDFFNQCGKKEINQQEFDRLTQAHKNREKIIERNNKLRTLKKPEDQVPYVDPIEQDPNTGKFYQICYKNLKYLNLVGNRMKIFEEDLNFLANFLEKMRESVVILSVNNIGEMVEERLIEYSDQVLL